MKTTEHRTPDISNLYVPMGLVYAVAAKVKITPDNLVNILNEIYIESREQNKRGIPVLIFNKDSGEIEKRYMNYFSNEQGLTV